MKDNFKIEKQTLEIGVEKLGIMEFYVLAYVEEDEVTRYGYKHFWFNLTTPPLPYKNQVPDFEDTVTETIEVEVN